MWHVIRAMILAIHIKKKQCKERHGDKTMTTIMRRSSNLFVFTDPLAMLLFKKEVEFIGCPAPSVPVVA